MAAIREFLRVKVATLTARAGRLAELNPGTVGIRVQDRPYAPSPAHFAAANRRLGEIYASIAKRLTALHENWERVSPGKALVYVALVEREVDRARRAFGMFFETFSQRGSVFAPALAAHDVIAADCYAAVRRAAPMTLRSPLLKPLTYMEHGFSPATLRRGVTLSRLLGEPNPFPVIRIPWDRDNPWQAVFLHEVGHNLQADLGIWHENKEALEKRLLTTVGDPLVTSVYGRWHKELFADLAAVLLGGPGSAWGMMEFLAHPAPRAMTFRPGGAHPTGYLRVLILAEMLRRMSFREEASRVERVWKGLYRSRGGHRIPMRLLESSSRTIPHVVDEIAFQTRRNLAQRALVDVMPFRKEDEEAIRKGAATLARGSVPSGLPPRFLVSASRYAIVRGASPPELSRLVINHLSRMAAGQRRVIGIPVVAAA